LTKLWPRWEIRQRKPIIEEALESAHRLFRCELRAAQEGRELAEGDSLLTIPQWLWAGGAA
jgi:hypothetical protein